MVQMRNSSGNCIRPLSHDFKVHLLDIVAAVSEAMGTTSQPSEGKERVGAPEPTTRSMVVVFYSIKLPSLFPHLCEISG